PRRSPVRRSAVRAGPTMAWHERRRNARPGDGRPGDARRTGRQGWYQARRRDRQRQRRDPYEPARLLSEGLGEKQRRRRDRARRPQKQHGAALRHSGDQPPRPSQAEIDVLNEKASASQSASKGGIR